MHELPGATGGRVAEGVSDGHAGARALQTADQRNQGSHAQIESDIQRLSGGTNGDRPHAHEQQPNRVHAAQYVANPHPAQG